MGWVALGGGGLPPGLTVGCWLFSGRDGTADGDAGRPVGFLARLGRGFGDRWGSGPVRSAGFAACHDRRDEWGTGGGVAVGSGAGGWGWRAGGVGAAADTDGSARRVEYRRVPVCRRVRSGRCRRLGLTSRAHLSGRVRR